MPSSDLSPIPPTPGVAVLRLQDGITDIKVAQLLPHDSSGKLNRYIVGFPGWLEAGVATRLSEHQAVHRAHDLIVLFDGHLSDVVADSVDGPFDLDCPASVISSLYRQCGTRTAFYLRGSFAALVINEGEKKAEIFSDRRGSRPIFFRKLNEQLLAAAPSVMALSKVAPTLSTLSTSAVLEFMMSMTFRGDHTIYPEVAKLPGGALLRFGTNRAVVERYWQMHFSIVDRNEEELIRECDAVLDQAIVRLLRNSERKVLFLSGGVDSRVILGYLQRHLGSKIDVAHYWSASSDGDDAAVAQRLAKQYKLKSLRYEISLDDFPVSAPVVTLHSDCRSEVLDSAPLHHFVDILGKEFDGFINGDECFGWRRNVATVDDALTEIGWYQLKQVRRLMDWIDPAISKAVEDEIQNHLASIASNAFEENPDNLKDRLYYEQRLGNMLNGYVGSKLHKLEPFRPLVDEDVIDFVCRIPNQWRGDKRLLRKLLKAKFPEMSAVPISKRDVIPDTQTFLMLMKSNEQIRGFFEEQLTVKLDPRLADIFSTRSFRDSVNAIFYSRALPPIRRNWLARLPGAWRLAKPPENRVHPLRLAMQLVQLNLYLSMSK